MLSPRRQRHPFTRSLPHLDAATATAHLTDLRSPRVGFTTTSGLYVDPRSDGQIRIRLLTGSPYYTQPMLHGSLVPTADGGSAYTGIAYESRLNVFYDILMWLVTLGGILLALSAITPPEPDPAPTAVIAGGLITAAVFLLIGLGTQRARRGFLRDVEATLDQVEGALTTTPRTGTHP